MRSITQERLGAVFDNALARSDYGRAYIRFACVQREGEYQLAAGSCTFLLGPGSEAGWLHRYESLALYGATMPAARAQAFVRMLINDGAAELPPLGRIVGQARWDWGTHLGSGERYVHTRCSWPSTLLRSGLVVSNEDRSILQQQEQLHAADAPLYPDTPTAVGHHLFGLHESAAGADYSGSLTVVLPDERARIAQVAVEGNLVVVAVERGTLPPDAEMAVRYYVSASSSTEHGVMPVRADTASIAASGPVARLLLHLVIPPDDILDELEFGLGFGRSADARVARSPGSVRAEIEAAIAGGEGPATEFKQSLETREEGRKLVESVAAFANGQGGLLLIGVDDEGSVYGHPTDERARIERMIADRCDPRPDVRIERVALAGLVVTVARVLRGTDPPYLAGSKFCVRHGANTVPGTRAELSHVAGLQGGALDALAGRVTGLR